VYSVGSQTTFRRNTLHPSSGSMNKMDAKYSFQVSVDFKRTTQCYIPERMALQIGAKIGAFELPDFLHVYCTPCVRFTDAVYSCTMRD
jgi:hypothetical protein